MSRRFGLIRGTRDAARGNPGWWSRRSGEGSGGFERQHGAHRGAAATRFDFESAPQLRNPTLHPAESYAETAPLLTRGLQDVREHAPAGIFDFELMSRALRCRPMSTVALSECRHRSIDSAPPETSTPTFPAKGLRYCARSWDATECRPALLTDRSCGEADRLWAGSVVNPFRRRYVGYMEGLQKSPFGTGRGRAGPSKLQNRRPPRSAGSVPALRSVGALQPGDRSCSRPDPARLPGRR